MFSHYFVYVLMFCTTSMRPAKNKLILMQILNCLLFSGY